MTRRIVTPVDDLAFHRARVAYINRYPNPQPQPGSREHRRRREAWLDLYAQEGGAVDNGAGFQARVPDDVVEPCPLKNRVARVEFLTGRNELTANAVQRVNLPAARKFVDGTRVTHLDRVGCALRATVGFQRKKKEQFKVALLGHSGNAVYSGPEQGHSAAFGRAARTPAAPEHTQGGFDHYIGAIYTSTTGGDGKAVIEGHFEVPPSGGDRYKLVAWDVNGNVAFSAFELETRRSLFYATFLADDPNGVRVDQAWFRGQIEAKYAPFGIELVHAGEATLDGIVYHDIVMQNVVGDAVRDLAATARSDLGVRFAELAPYLLKFVFVDQCAGVLRRDLQPVRLAAVNPGQVVQAPLYNNTPQQRLADLAFDWRKCLWAGMGLPLYAGDRATTGHDWFESATLVSHRDTGDVTVNLTAADLTPVARVGEPGAMVEVSFAIPDDFPAGVDATFTLNAVIVNRTVMGQSMTAPYAGTTLQPARSMFVGIPANKQLSSAIHEFGHAIGMVVEAAQQGLGHPRMYDHQGRHCWHGVAGPAAQVEDYHRPPLKDTGDCVMYGLIPDAGPNMDFCADCGAALRKLDLSAGFTG